jgi:hypothetical protein
MQTFLFYILIVLGPSLAALAWFIWYSGALENPARDQREPWPGS